VARRLAPLGARLALSGRREADLRALADEIAASGAEAPVVLSADLGQRGAAARLAADANSTLGHVDVLINNAGVTMQGLTWIAADGEEARVVFETNLWSPLALVAALAPGMIERGRGTIVNIGSMAGVSPLPRIGGYAASRSALATATNVMQLELRPRGVRVVEVVFGPIDTPAGRQSRVIGAPDSRRMLGSLDGAAQTIVNAVTGDTEGVVFFPRTLRWSRTLPAITRAVSRALAKNADVEDTTVHLGRPPRPADGSE
jgi:short-subunit dehydrogenase